MKVVIGYKNEFMNLENLDSLSGSSPHTEKEREYVIKAIQFFLRNGISKDNKELPYKAFNPVADVCYVEIKEYKP